MAFFYSSPQCTNNIVTVGNALDSLNAFNAIYALSANCANNLATNCKANQNQIAEWKKNVRDGVILCGGEPTELDFFENALGGAKTMITDAKDIYIKYNCDVDKNIYSATTAVAPTPGAATTFVIHRSLYDATGKYSNVSVGGQIYIYKDKQLLTVTAVDKTTDFAHQVTVIPNHAAYTINIQQNVKMMYTPVRLVGGLSDAKPASTWRTNGYISKISPFRLRIDWEYAIDLSRTYQDVLQFAIMFDNNGNQIDTWEFYEKTQAREQFRYAKNLYWFLGHKADNPTLSNNNAYIDSTYEGFDGYLQTLLYGGGTLYDYDPSIGFDLDSDFQSIILRQDSLKQVKEFVGMVGLPFILNMERRFNQSVQNYSGQCTFESFKRSGMDGEEVLKQGVRSYRYGNYSLHFKQMSAFSDTRSIGNDDIPYYGFLVPGTGLRDSKGRSVPAFEFYMPTGATESGAMEEVDVDYRKTILQDKMGGYIAETIQFATHCPGKHIMLNPQRPCA